jgi:dienelactone hydrolase
MQILRSDMMRKYLWVLFIGFLVLFVVPVLVAQISGSEQRMLESSELEDIDFQEIEFQNVEQNLGLAGMLLVPEGEGPFPAVVIIHGSGSSHRGNGWYLTLVDYLQKNGVVVLLPDKRGSEKSEGDWHTASFEDLATDTLAAIHFLKTQDEVDISNIGIIGMSQGGTIAPLVANQAQEIDFLVNVVGGAVPMYEMLVFEENHNLREMGVLPGISNLLAYPAAWSLIYARQSEFWGAVGNFDPVPYWENLGVKSLVLYGEEDTNTPTQKSVKVFRSLEKPNIEVRVYEGSGHALESPEGKGNSIFREEALMEIRDFIHSASISE